MATVTINTGTNYQTISGWEMTAQTGLNTYLTTGQNWHDAALDALVDLGINRLRVEILSGIVENSTDYWGNYLADGRDYTTNAEYSAYSTNRRIPVNDNADPNVINSSGFKFTFIDWQIDNFVTPLKTKLATNGETLFWVLTYVHFSASNQLHIDTPAEYGELILAIWQHIDTTYGASYLPDALEIFLEPNNTAAVTESEFAAMTIAARDRLVAAGFTKPYMIGPSTSISSLAVSYYNNIKSANATAAGYIDEFSRHRYDAGTLDDTTIANIRTTGLADGKKLSMLETGAGGTLDANGGNGMVGLHQDLKVGRVSAWAQFTGAYPGTDDGNAYFIPALTNPWGLTEGFRTKYLRHYFKFIRRGAVMKDVTNSSSNYDGLAFENSNGTYAVVVKCSTNGTIDIVNLPAGTYAIRYTSGDWLTAPSSYWQTIANQTITGGQNVSFSMPAAGVVSVYDINYLTSTPPGDPTSLVATRGNSSQANVSWSLADVTETSVVLEHSTNLSTWTEIALGAGVESHNVTGLTPGITYHFRVKAVNSGGASGYSNTDDVLLTNIKYFFSTEPPLT